MFSLTVLIGVPLVVCKWAAAVLSVELAWRQPPRRRYNAGMRKRLRKKLGVGEFERLGFYAIVRVGTETEWGSFFDSLGDFMSDRWCHWSFAYQECPGLERRILVGVGHRREAEQRRSDIIEWLSRHQLAALIAAEPVAYDSPIRRIRRKRRKTR
ncbi:MAG TPA: 50S ribosome-binding protein YggL [Pirellulales bacterium]|nr:50S ribosome-binding protein YggL [Pirellulales bacterium]